VTGDQKVAFIKTNKVRYTTAEQVVQGEESRVDDWDPKRDGYGYFGTAVYKTGRGHTAPFKKGWFFKDWDVPDSAFEVDPPEWTDGLAYLQAYLARQNKEKTVQVLRVAKRGGLWKKIVLGGKYTVQHHAAGTARRFRGVFRVLAYTPDERQGVMEIIGEWI
jgi:hypothetical protein